MLYTVELRPKHREDTFYFLVPSLPFLYRRVFQSRNRTNISVLNQKFLNRRYHHFIIATKLRIQWINLLLENKGYLASWTGESEQSFYTNLTFQLAFHLVSLKFKTKFSWTLNWSSSQIDLTCICINLFSEESSCNPNGSAKSLEGL